MEYRSRADFQERAGYVIDGVWYPRVTAIINIKAKPGLYRYYASMPSHEAAVRVKEQSAQEGTDVHTAVEAIFRGHQPIITPITEAPIDAFMEFLRNTHVEPLALEERIVHRGHGYAGTLDAVVRMNGVVGILDIKTSKSMHREYGLQLAAYRSALEDMRFAHPITTAWVLRLDQASNCTRCGAVSRSKGGTARVTGGGRIPCNHDFGSAQGLFELTEVTSYEHDLKAFLAAKELWTWEHQRLLTYVRSL